MSEPFPKEFVMEAWKARVGYSLERLRTHPAYVELAFELMIEVKTNIFQGGQDVCVITKKYAIDAP